jgi:hypothetical protein
MLSARSISDAMSVESASSAQKSTPTRQRGQENATPETQPMTRTVLRRPGRGLAKCAGVPSRASAVAGMNMFAFISTAVCCIEIVDLKP